MSFKSTSKESYNNTYQIREMKNSDLQNEVKQNILKDIRESIGDKEYMMLLNSIEEDDLIELYLSQLKIDSQSEAKYKKKKSLGEKTKNVIRITFRTILIIIFIIGFFSGMSCIKDWYGKVILGVFLFPGLYALNGTLPWDYSNKNLSDLLISAICIVISAILILWGIIQGL